MSGLQCLVKEAAGQAKLLRMAGSAARKQKTIGAIDNSTAALGRRGIAMPENTARANLVEQQQNLQRAQQKLQLKDNMRTGRGGPVGPDGKPVWQGTAGPGRGIQEEMRPLVGTRPLPKGVDPEFAQAYPDAATLPAMRQKLQLGVGDKAPAVAPRPGQYVEADLAAKVNPASKEQFINQRLAPLGKPPAAPAPTATAGGSSAAPVAPSAGSMPPGTTPAVSDAAGFWQPYKDMWAAARTPEKGFADRAKGVWDVAKANPLHAGIPAAYGAGVAKDYGDMAFENDEYDYGMINKILMGLNIKDKPSIFSPLLPFQGRHDSIFG